MTTPAETIRKALESHKCLFGASYDELNRALAALALMEADMTRLTEAVNGALTYMGPKWPNEMTLREKLAYLATGDLYAKSLTDYEV